MRLSVVIPTYNRKDSLIRTLDGLRRQDFPTADFEVIVVSDGGTDGTMDMLAAYSAPFELRCFEQRNSGPSAARNRGIRESRNDIVVFLDDDVEPNPDFLTRHAEHHRADSHIVVIGPMLPDPALARAEPVWIAWEHRNLQRIYNFFRPGGQYVSSGPQWQHFYSGNASVRRQWLLAVDGFDETYTRQEDVELAARLQKHCGVHFIIDFSAIGIHRPRRTFQSWLFVPQSYGRFDAIRVKGGLLDAASVHKQAGTRHPLTRMLMSLCDRSPRSLDMIVRGTRTLSPLLYRIGLRDLAVAMLSGIYNASYIVYFNRELKLPEAYDPGGKESKVSVS